MNKKRFVFFRHLQALDDFDRLREVALVGNLDDVSPDALVILGEDGRDVLHGRRAGSHGGVQGVEGAVAVGQAGEDVGVSQPVGGRVARRVFGFLALYLMKSVFTASQFNLWKIADTRRAS